jgi:hypothetical protein
MDEQEGRLAPAVDLYWIPLGAGGDVVRARRVLDLAPSVPTPVWGRDELRTGEMWNSNSLISWLLARAGIDTGGLEPPAGGRAPGWNAGLVMAGRQMQHRAP